MAGYFSATKNLSELDIRYVQRNAKVVGGYCKAHKSDTVMNAMQKNWR
jgi:acid stress chaperone HdeB